MNSDFGGKRGMNSVGFQLQSLLSAKCISINTENRMKIDLKRGKISGMRRASHWDSFFSVSPAV
jgi:hypothetical protein